MKKHPVQKHHANTNRPNPNKMTTRMTRHDANWINNHQEWNLPRTDTHDKSLLTGNGKMEGKHKAKRFKIKEMKPAHDGKPSVIAIRQTGSRTTNECILSTHKMLKDNCEKCKNCFVTSDVNKQWCKNLHECKETKLRSGCEECKESCEVKIETNCNNHMMRCEDNDNWEESEQSNELETRMPNLPETMSDDTLEEKTGLFRDMLRDEDEDWMDGQ